jgi:hypothetical protein
MRKYESRKPGAKSEKDRTVKIRHRMFGSTHASPTKERIVRGGKKRARKEAQEETNEATGD